MQKKNWKDPTWQEIEEEFRKEYVVKSNAGTGLLRYTDADKIINFFKPYFQEKMHEEAVEELEIGIYCTQCDNNKPRVPGGILMLCEKCSKKLQGK